MPKKEEYIDGDYDWGIDATDTSSATCPASITYKIKNPSVTGSCAAATTGFCIGSPTCTFTPWGSVPAGGLSLPAITKGGSISNWFRVEAERSGSQCRLSFEIFPPVGPKVDPEFCVSAPGSACFINVKTVYPLVESHFIPIINGKPDFTKTMPIKFVTTARKTDILSTECTSTNCMVSYKLEGFGGFTNANWDVFSRAWVGERTSSDLTCDSGYKLLVRVRYSDGLQATLESNIHINCNPRIVVEPAERRVALTHNNIDAFAVTVYDPDFRRYTLTMTNDDPAHTFLFGASRWLEFVCPGGAVTCTPAVLQHVPTWTDSDGDGVKDAGEPDSPQPIVVRLTSHASTRAGNYPITFEAES